MPRRRWYQWATARFPVRSRSGTSSGISSGKYWGRRKEVPSRPKRPCSYPGCPKLTDGQYCEDHAAVARRQYNKYQRAPDINKKYGRAWKRIRDRHITLHPLCEMCLKEDMLTPAQEVHHILPISKGGTHSQDNLMSLCRSCHNKIHIEMGDR